MNKEKLICIVICTRNRDYIIRECLNSLVNQTADKSLFNVLIVDNNSSDNTKDICLEFTQQFENFFYVCEKNEGLSYAKNRGYQEAKATWIGYVDDDAKAHPNYVERSLWVIKNFNFDAFGGQYLPWYKYGKPRWIPENFGTNGKLREDVGELEKGYLSGGISFFKRFILVEINGFSTKLGMTGKTMAYGEETLLQILMKERGYTIGFDPNLHIDHLVNKYKLNPWWILKSYYKRGLNYWQSNQLKNNLTDARTILKYLASTVVKHILIFTPKLKKKNYYWQNWLLDVFSLPASLLGKLIGVFKS